MYWSRDSAERCRRNWKPRREAAAVDEIAQQYGRRDVRLAHITTATATLQLVAIRCSPPDNCMHT
jgi:hypothetical protein